MLPQEPSRHGDCRQGNGNYPIYPDLLGNNPGLLLRVTAWREIEERSAEECLISGQNSWYGRCTTWRFDTHRYERGRQKGQRHDRHCFHGRSIVLRCFVYLDGCQTLTLSYHVDSLPVISPCFVKKNAIALTKLISFRSRDSFASERAFKLVSIWIWNCNFGCVCGNTMIPVSGLCSRFLRKNSCCRIMFRAECNATSRVSIEWIACLAKSCSKW